MKRAQGDTRPGDVVSVLRAVDADEEADGLRYALRAVQTADYEGKHPFELDERSGQASTDAVHMALIHCSLHRDGSGSYFIVPHCIKLHFTPLAQLRARFALREGVLSATVAAVDGAGHETETKLVVCVCHS